MNRRAATALLATLPWAPAQAAGTLQAPNVVPVSARLVTSGQPSAAALAGLAALDFGAVIYLAPPTVADAVPDEAAIVRRQGLQFVNLPIPFDAPTVAHFDAFREVMAEMAASLPQRRLLVHCQINLRASTLVFLHRVVVGGESPALAYEAVAKVWSPQGPWRTLVLAVLQRHGIDFDPY